MLDKKKIKESFSRAAATYDGNSLFQREVGGEVFSLVEKYTRLVRFAACEGFGPVPVPGGGKILDIGCGTGNLMDMIGRACPGSVFGCDIALPMLVRAGEKFPGLRAGLAAGDSESLPYRGSSFDLVVSNLTFQWVPDLRGSLGEVMRVLKDGGLFIFSTLGPGTLIELRSSYAQVCLGNGLSGEERLLPFTGADVLRACLEGAGFTVLEARGSEVTRTYKDPLTLLKTLKNIGAHQRTNGAGDNLRRGAVLREVLRVYRENHPSPGGGVKATYGVVFFIARK